MDAVNSAAAVLKQSVGLPTNVNPAVAPLPAASAPAPGQAAPPLAKSAEELLALKDQAIADKDDRIKALEAANEQGLQSVMQMMDAKLNPPQAPKPPELPPLPDNLDSLPAKEQIELIADRKATEKVAAAIATEREAMMAALAPVLVRTKQAAEVTDRLAVEAKYNQFDYAKMKPEMDKVGVELPSSTPLERAALAATRTGNEAMLMPGTPQAPASMPAVPSMRTAAGVAGAQPPQGGPTYGQVWTRAAELGMKRNSVDQGVLLDELIKSKVKLPFSNER